MSATIIRFQLLVFALVFKPSWTWGAFGEGLSCEVKGEYEKLQTQQASAEESIHRELFARATESFRYHPEGRHVDLFPLNCSCLFSVSLHFRDGS